MRNALEEHSRSENDLRRLFDETSRQMESTEGDIQQLMDLAQQMQQQMNQQAEQQRDQLNQPQDQPESGERPDNDNDSTANPQGHEENPEGTPGSGTPGTTSGERDPNAWDALLPRAERQRGADSSPQASPQRWRAESSEYFRLLAEQARRERASREARERESREREGR